MEIFSMTLSSLGQLFRKITKEKKQYVQPQIDITKNSREYYKKYLADDKIRPLNEKLIEVILSYSPKRIFEFGAGVGKNIKLLWERKPDLIIMGVDVSKMNKKHALVDCIKLGGEELLKTYGNFDVVFTCSVLDHIKNIDGIITQLKEKGKVIILMETNSYDTEFYYKHNYESYGFKNIGYKYTTEEDGDKATYEIWVYENTSAKLSWFED